jgi:hypothetical protein
VRHTGELPRQQALDLRVLTVATLRRALAAAACILAVALLVAGTAGAQGTTPGADGLAPVPPTAKPTTTTADPGALIRPAAPDVPPPGWRLTANQAVQISGRVEKVRAAAKANPGYLRQAFQKGVRRWQVSYYDRRGKEIAQVYVDDVSGRVTEAWTGPAVAWTMARGYPGAFGRKVNAWYVWLPLCVLFVAPFLRRPFRLLHLDLAVLLAFSVSYWFFNRAEIDVSVPLVAPLLLYLLVRALMLTRAPPPTAPPPRLPMLVPVTWLAVALVFLLGFRIALNVADSNVIDVGYSGVIGAERLTAGTDLYGGWPNDNAHGDTYGPANYGAYVPFELAFPWTSGKWDDLPAAHAAAIAFDLLAVVLVFLLGLRLRGPATGVVLAYLWATFPFTLLVLNTNANDALVAVLVTAALLVAMRPALRGAALAMAGLTKLAPLALAPVFALARLPGQDRRWWHRALPFAVAFALTAAVALAPVWLADVWDAFWDHTIRYQAERPAPFSVWGLHGWDTAQTLVQAGAVALIAAATLSVARGTDLRRLAAWTAVILLALQLGVTYWFYLYLAWILPPFLGALVARHREPAW